MGNKPLQNQLRNSSSSHLEREAYENVLSEFGEFLKCFKDSVNDLKCHHQERLPNQERLLNQHPSNDVGPCKVEERFQRLIFPMPEIENREQRWEQIKIWVGKVTRNIFSHGFRLY